MKTSEIEQELRSNDNLRNVEIFKTNYWINSNDELFLDYNEFLEATDTETTGNSSNEEGIAWFYWFCMPGCLPDSEPCGPFDTEKQAAEDAIETFGY